MAICVFRKTPSIILLFLFASLTVSSDSTRNQGSQQTSNATSSQDWRGNRSREITQYDYSGEGSGMLYNEDYGSYYFPDESYESDMNLLDIYYYTDRVSYYFVLIVGSSGVVLNMMTLITLVYAGPLLPKVQSILLINLALADLLVCLLNTLKKAIPDDIIYGTTVHRKWYQCVYSNVMTSCSFSYTATFLLLVLIAINHYLLVCKPFHYIIIISRRRALKAVGVIWMLSVLVQMTDFIAAFHQFNMFKSGIDTEGDYGSSLGDVDPHVNSSYLDYCIEVSLVTSDVYLPVSWIIFTCMVVIGVFILIFVYTCIFKKAYESLNFSWDLSEVELRQRRQKRYSISTSLFLLTGFLIVYLPYCTAFSVVFFFIRQGENLRGNNESYWWWYLAFITDNLKEPLLILNAFSDPVIYILRLSAVRKVILGILGKSEVSRSTQTNNTSQVTVTVSSV